MSDHIHATLADGVLTLTLDRPTKMNALTDGMYHALAEHLEDAQTDPAVRVIVLGANGDHFCAGNDLADFASVAAGSRDLVGNMRLIRALAANLKILVAGVQGRAVGIGATALLHCDHVVLAPDALLSFPFVNLGLVPEAASSLLLTARVGHLKAFSLFALGDPVDAGEAVAIGLANKVVSRAGLENACAHIASELARRPADGLMATKRLMRERNAILDRIDEEVEEFGQRLLSDDARAAIEAFTGKAIR